MNKDTTNNPVPAFPITAGTLQVTPTDVPCASKIVHVPDGGDVTFHYASGDVVITASVGQDFSVDDKCTGITSAVVVTIG